MILKSSYRWKRISTHCWNINPLLLKMQKAGAYIAIVCGLLICFCTREKSPDKSPEAGPETRIVKEFYPNGRLKSATEAVGKLRQGLSREYRADGTLESEIYYDQNRKHGSAKSYYADGKTVKNELRYVNGYRQGDAKWYYQSGKIYRVTPYEKNQINGVRYIYYENGNLQAEIPYQESQPGTGLKEYTPNGSLKAFSAVIRIEEADRLDRENRYSLVLSMSDGSRNVEFFTGELTGGKYWNDELTPVPTENGTGRIDFIISRGKFRMETINIVARVRTSLGNPRILQKEYYLAVENRF